MSTRSNENYEYADVESFIRHPKKLKKLLSKYPEDKEAIVNSLIDDSIEYGLAVEMEETLIQNDYDALEISKRMEASLLNSTAIKKEEEEEEELEAYEPHNIFNEESDMSAIIDPEDTLPYSENSKAASTTSPFMIKQESKEFGNNVKQEESVNPEPSAVPSAPGVPPGQTEEERKAEEAEFIRKGYSQYTTDEERRQIREKYQPAISMVDIGEFEKDPQAMTRRFEQAKSIHMLREDIARQHPNAIGGTQAEKANVGMGEDYGWRFNGPYDYPTQQNNPGYWKIEKTVEKFGPKAMMKGARMESLFSLHPPKRKTPDYYKYKHLPRKWQKLTKGGMEKWEKKRKRHSSNRWERTIQLAAQNPVNVKTTTASNIPRQL